MKVIIDLIEDIRSAINSESSFSLSVMGLKENKKAEFIPSWQSSISQYKIDKEKKKIFLFLGRDEGLKVGEFLKALNSLGNEEMMYEVCVSYTRENRRVDTSLMGFGESFEDKKYLLFIPEEE